MQSLSILGSTGSIGTQALEIVDLHPDLFSVAALCARSQKEKLFQQARRYHPAVCGLVDPVPESEIPQDLKHIQWVMGPEALHIIAAQVPCDMVLVSVVGIAGLPAVMDALDARRQVLLANKEALVTGGHLVMEKASAIGKPLLPVDSEHSAIFQCLQTRGSNPPVRLLLTASGGPFRTWKKEDIDRATPAQALRHPNWSMGQKITIDSASMFNKALEIMEARWLFDVSPDNIQVVIHPQSVIHSAVEFADGAVLAQLGVPDMRVPIAYAMHFPDRISTGSKSLDLFEIGSLTFEREDPVRFPALSLARQCLHAGGAACTVLNGANEEAVAAFLAGRIPFGAITRTVMHALDRLPSLPADTLDDIYTADRLARETSRKYLASQEGA